MKAINRIVTLLLMWSLMVTGAIAGTSDLRTVEATGQGVTEREAIEQAMRNAAEKAVGVLIHAETVSRDFQVQSDRVRASAEAFIESYEVINKRTDAEGATEVEIRAAVNLGSIKDGIQALKILTDRKNNPTFVVINEYEDRGNRAEYEVNVAATGAVNKYLGARLLEVVDPARVNELREDDVAIQQEAQQKKVSMSQLIANKLKADVYAVVIGHVGRSASLNVRFFESSTGRILGEESAYTPALGGDLADQKTAVETATSKATDKAFASLLNYWRRDTDRGSQTVIVVNGLNFSGKGKFRKILAAVGREVKQLNSADGHAEFVVWSEKSAADLMEDIGGQALESHLGQFSQDPALRGNRIIFNFK